MRDRSVRITERMEGWGVYDAQTAMQGRAGYNMGTVLLNLCVFVRTCAVATTCKRAS